ncbi:hypothetical protein F7725_017571 [Dissostichus mawsoni]|uniref:Uncharacterized protein n=1 Tax=Dissostichus mawsoni TaxID=36200 RepID=A0A7J5Z932_DISMA|nr:hypothetical protein F7725_017571 [Dissostichus mawsoni]
MGTKTSRCNVTAACLCVRDLLQSHTTETYKGSSSHILKQRIPVLGKLHLRAFHDANTASATLFIVKSGSILLGLDLFEALPTPHATTGTSPFQLMYGRKMRTKLSILPQLTDTQDQELRDRVEKKQWHMKTYTDAKRNAKIPKIHPGSLVRVRNPLHRPSRKDLSYTLDNGKTWDASHLSVLPETFTPPSEEVRPAEPATVDGAQSRNQRIRKQPAWIEDYVT